MAASVPPAIFHPLIPVTPPPEQQNFRKPGLPPTSQFGRHIPLDIQEAIAQAHLHTASLPGSTPIFGQTGLTSRPPQPRMQTQTQTQIQAQPQAQAQTHKETTAPIGNNAETAPAGGPPPSHMDPRYMAMVSRIAAYYQQRCVAITNAQQQRCRAWADTHRKKCEDTRQAAMLVVAWYIRDRIQRRRRKQKRSFRAGLRVQDTKARVAKGEHVRRWVMQLSDQPASPHVPALDDIADEEEASFSMDRDVPMDKDAKLFQTADQLIRSQYRKLEVPMLGMMSFDESDSDSEPENDNDNGNVKVNVNETGNGNQRNEHPWNRPGLGPAPAPAPAQVPQQPVKQQQPKQEVQEEDNEDDAEGDYDDEEDYDEEDYDYEDGEDYDEDYDDSMDDGEYQEDEAAMDSQAVQRGTATGSGSRLNNNSQSS